MCSQNAGNVISEPQILKISPGPPLESLSMSPPRQNQNSTPVPHHLFVMYSSTIDAICLFCLCSQLHPIDEKNP